MQIFELVLVHPEERAVAHLPPLELAAGVISDADFVLEAVLERFGVRATMLMRLDARRGPSRRFEWYRYALRAGSAELPAGLAWVDDASVHAALAEVAEDQPWARPGWWPALVAWIEEKSPEPVAAVEQVRAWDLSTVVRVRLASGASLFYKAVPRAFGPEPALTAFLGERAPGRVPAVVAHDFAHRGMLLEACPGTRLDALEGQDAWERVARAYAEVQRACAGDVARLVQLGVPHRPLADLPAAWERLLSDPACLQPGSHADLTADEIAALSHVDGARVAEWVGRLDARESIEHGDFHSGNAFLAGDRVSVIDWTDAAVTHPFLSLVTFSRPIERVARAYLDVWGAADTDLSTLARVSAVFQTVHYRERLVPLVRRYDEIRTAVPAYARRVLTPSSP